MPTNSLTSQGRARRRRSDFLGDGEQRVAVDRRLLAAFLDRLQRRQQRRDPGLVVQVAGADMAALGELRQRIEGHVVTHRDAQALAVGATGGIGVETQLDVVPTDLQVVHLGIEGVARSQQRQHAATEHALFGEHRDPATLGEAARPAAYRGQAEAAVGLDLADQRADRVEVRGNRPVGGIQAALEGRPDGSPASHLEGHAKFVELLGDIAHDGIGEAGGAGDGEHLQQHPLQVVEVRLWQRGHEGTSRLRGKRRSTKRSAVGCGSWLARPARSLASMIT